MSAMTASRSRTEARLSSKLTSGPAGGGSSAAALPFLAGAFWSPAVGYLSEWLGLTVAFVAMAASFMLASACVLFGRFHRIAIGQEPGAIAQRHH